MKWLRQQHPTRTLRVIQHGYYGHVVWTTDNEAGVYCTVARLLDDYRKEGL